MMKRRDFVYGSAISGVAAIAQSLALGQTAAPVAATRTFSLCDGSGDVVRDVIFDGAKVLSLIVSGTVSTLRTAGATVTSYGRGQGAGASVTATAPDGSRLWTYPLPIGLYWSLGTSQGNIVVFGPTAMLQLDPRTGAVTNLGPGTKSRLYYAGDSTFFTPVSQAGEIWTLEGSALSRRFAGIALQALAAPSSCIEYVPSSGNVAIMPRDGASIALISTSSGTAVQHTISSDLITNSPSQGGVRSMAIVAIGGDRSGNVLALINGQNQSTGGISLVQVDSNANVSYLGSMQLPVRSQGIPVLPSKLVCMGSVVAIVSAAGVTALYPRPAA